MKYESRFLFSSRINNENLSNIFYFIIAFGAAEKKQSLEHGVLLKALEKHCK